MSDEGQDQVQVQVQDPPIAEPMSLHDLPVDDAIRLRWVLRDIRSGRTKLLTPSSNDLAWLQQHGLITMDDGNPALTDAANWVIGAVT